MENFTRDTTGLEVVETFADQIAGKTFVITGPSINSLAAEATYCLAQSVSPPSQIILLGRSLSKIQPVRDRIQSLNPNISIYFITLDLADLNSIRTCAAEVNKLTSKIDVLINSAGIMALERYQTSTGGFEMQLAACHIGHFLLTACLLPLLNAAPTPRVVTLTSMGYEMSNFRFNDYNFSGGETYNRWTAYGQAKTANILFTTELARRAAAQNLSLQAYVLHPGIILSSGIMKEVSEEEIAKQFEDSKAESTARGVEYVPEKQKTIETGCATMLVASLAPGLESGSFLKDAQVYDKSEWRDYARSETNAKNLWELSEGWVGEKVL